MVSKRWNFPEVDSENLADLCRGTRCSKTLASVLLCRGVSNLETATRFLEPRLLDLADPQILPNIDRAVERITRAIRACGQPDEQRPDGEKVAIFGDYDVDGVSSTCLLLDFFRLLECPVDFRLPDRLREGYGLRTKVVEELAAKGTTLIITVDNGSSSRREIEVARELGVDVVVIDHHQPSAQLPEPYALVNPWLAEHPRDGGDLDCHGSKDLAGVGVTFKVVWALCQHFSRAKRLSPRFRQFLLDSMALVALGTVADVVPLREENRVLTKFGLVALQNSSRAGLKKLVELSRRGGAADEPLDASHIGFRIGPRLNAAGRLGRADDAIRLLMTESEPEAEKLLQRLESENQRRRTIEGEILEEARARIQTEYDLTRDRCIVLGDAAWHPGVVGIVASRLVSEFYRPTLLFAFDGDRGRGSARSIPGVSIYDAMERAKDHMIQFGGHAMAAGAEIAVSALPALRDALNAAIDMPPSEMIPAVQIDCRLSLDELGADLLQDLSRLAPHGEGNPTPLFAATDVEIVGQSRLIGKDGKHLSFHVRQPGGRGPAYRAVAFGMGARYPEVERRGTRVSLLFELQWNVWQGRRSIELLVRDIRPSDEASRV